MGLFLGLVSVGSTHAEQITRETGNVGAFATVNGVSLSRSQRDSFIKQAGLPDNDTTRTQVENDMISGEVVRQAAEKDKYSDRQEVKAVVEMAKARSESELYLQDHAKIAPIPDKQVKERYDAMIAGAGSQEYNVRVISATDDTAATAVLKQLKQGRSFDDVARQYSVASNRAMGGAMGWVTFKTPVREGQTQGVPFPIAQALEGLKAGEYTQTPIVLGNARVIVKLDDVRPTKIRPYDRVKDELREQMEMVERQQAVQTLVQRLVKEAIVQRN
ncbi:hypothetical protein WT37_26615 [Burkholderia territorii]|nr:hypothetical protein WT37_26615 [Burkholderia territorii]